MTQSIACPHCPDQRLNLVRDPGTKLEIDVCPECVGIWFDADELAAFFNSSDLFERYFEAEPESGDLSCKGRRSCPRCGGRLRLSFFGTTVLDLCDACRGIWFDGGELQQVVENYRKGITGDPRVTNQLAVGLARADLARTEYTEELKALYWFFASS